MTIYQSYPSYGQKTVRKTTTVYEYDENGKLIKTTVTVEEETPGYYTTTWTPSNPNVWYTGGGIH